MSTFLSSSVAYHYRLADIQCRVNHKKNNNSYYSLHPFHSNTSDSLIITSCNKKNLCEDTHREHLSHPNHRSLLLHLQEGDEDDDDLAVFIPSPTSSPSSSLRRKQRRQIEQQKKHEKQEKTTDREDDGKKLRKTNESQVHHEVYSGLKTKNHYDKYPSHSHHESSPVSSVVAEATSTRDKVIVETPVNSNLKEHIPSSLGLNCKTSTAGNDQQQGTSLLSPSLTAKKMPAVNGSGKRLQDRREIKEYLFKVLVIGELGTGKTSYIKRYVHQFFSSHYRATIGVDFALKVMKWNRNGIVRVQLWDIAGQERFGQMTRVYYKEAAGAVIVFDVSRSDSFEAVLKWKTDLDSKVCQADGATIPTLLLANKCDERKSTFFDDESYLDTFCQDNGFIGWFYTSPKENVNIEESANFLIKSIIASKKKLTDSQGDSSDSDDAENGQVVNLNKYRSTNKSTSCC